MTHDGIVLLMAGWLGEGTMSRVVAPALAQNGFDVMTVGHPRNAPFWDSDRERAKDIHDAAKQAVIITGKAVLHLIGHSKAGQDAVNFMNFVEHNRERLCYSVYGFGSVSAVGRNGYSPSPFSMAREVLANTRTIRGNYNNEAALLRMSANNLLRNPLLAVAEGITALKCDTEADIDRLRDGQVFEREVEIYGTKDRIVPKPTGRTVDEYEGHHMTPLLEPDICLDVAFRLAA